MDSRETTKGEILMCIHTCEVSTMITFDEASPYDDMLILLSPIGFTEDMVHNLAYPHEGKPVYYEVNLASDYPYLGIETVSIFKTSYMQDYIMILRINPQLLITHEKTIDLFKPTEENNQLLFNAFREAMGQFFPYEDVCDLKKYICRRIDYTHNFRFSSEAECMLYYHLIHKTSKYKWRRKKKSMSKEGEYEQSAAEANKSSKTMLYDKLREIEENHDLPERDLHLLKTESVNLIRFELQCWKNKVIALKNSKDFKAINLEKFKDVLEGIENKIDRNIEYYLDENLAHSLLIKAYDDAVGRGDFYELDSATVKIDNEDSISTRLRNNLIKFMKLVSQAKSLSAGRKQFISNKGGLLKGTNIIVKGSLGTYYRYLRILKDINLNPVLIPKHKSEKYGINELHNPIDELILE